MLPMVEKIRVAGTIIEAPASFRKYSRDEQAHDGTV
jgi:hypothetical protein